MSGARFFCLIIAMLLLLMPGCSTVEEKKSSWNYVEEPDPIRQEKIRTAFVWSKDMLPGDTCFKLTMRNHPKYGGNIWVSIEHGDFERHEGYMAVRFDNMPMEYFAYLGETEFDASGKCLHIYDNKRFSDRVRTATTVYMELPIRGQGEKIVSFRVEGLE